MTPFIRGGVLLCLLAVAGTGQAESPSVSIEGSQDSGVPISKLVAIVAKKTSKKFVLDPRVHANITLVGQDPADLNYSDLLTVLRVYGYSTVEDGGYVQIVPDANGRQLPTPLVTSKDSRPAAEVVTALIAVKSISAAQLVPILRPLIPQAGHLAAFACINTLIISDSFANVRRIEAMIRAIDTREPLPPADCGPPKPTPSSN